MCFEIFSQKPSMALMMRCLRTKQSTTVQFFSIHTLKNVSLANNFVELLNVLSPRDFFVSVTVEQLLFRSPIFLMFIFHSTQTQQKTEVSFVSIKTITVRIFQTNVINLSDLIPFKDLKQFFCGFLSVADGEKLHIHNPFCCFRAASCCPATVIYGFGKRDFSQNFSKFVFLISEEYNAGPLEKSLPYAILIGYVQCSRKKTKHSYKDPTSQFV